MQVKCVARVFAALTVFSQQTRSLVITGVNLIDATGQPTQNGMTIVMANERIAAIGKTGKVKIPANAEIVDGAGKFLMAR